MHLFESNATRSDGKTERKDSEKRFYKNKITMQQKWNFTNGKEKVVG